ncbi:hypothetical protein ABT304_17065 [Nocardioides sp. NPDC000445]|uniref:hypothetical protein n=1 Tax=Nocardioides sp. NPDC000445 TaxID=3154257 RepID=UPI0033274486
MAPLHLLAWKPVQAVRIAVTDSSRIAISSRQSVRECSGAAVVVTIPGCLRREAPVIAGKG